jgi:hypothetical protein
VFKGASAGSFAMARTSGCNMLLQQKRGKAGKLKASVSTSVSIDQINRRHDLQTSGQGEWYL